MPELPEVETIRHDLNQVLRNKSFKSVKINKPKMVAGSVPAFKKRLIENQITNIERRGKLLIFHLADKPGFLLIHLKMTGQLIYQNPKKIIAGGHPYPALETLPNAHTHAHFVLSDNSHLFFNDLRQFGYLRLVDQEELTFIKLKFGIEPLRKSFTPELLWQLIHSRKTYLKNVLLNQQIIAGLGNIYVDESCFHAKIKPTRRANTITKKEAQALQKAIKHILTKALQYRGTTFGTFRDGLGEKGNFVRLLKVYGRGKEKCLKCKTPLKKVKVAGRGTVFCPQCQK